MIAKIEAITNNGNLYSFQDGANRNQVTAWAVEKFKTSAENLVIKAADGMGFRWQVQKIG